MKRHLILLVSTLALLGSSAIAQTKVPALINYQGNVRNAAGVAIGAGTAVNRTVTFRFWKSPTSVLAADRLWSESQTATILDGNFNVLIGTGTAVTGETNAVTPFANVFGQSSAVYLGITVDDGNAGTVDAEISPRQQLVSGAFAFRATVAEGVDSSAITTSMLSSNSVTTNQLGAAAVTTAKIANNAITSVQILNGTIGVDKLGTGAVTADKILDGTITGADIAAGAVGTSQILDASITGADIANNTIPLAALAQAVKNFLVPVGTITAYGGSTAPDGWLLCDGASVSRSTYASLYAVISTAYGSADVNSFNVPDFRGRFLRGWDNAIGRDPDRASRTAMATGGNTGDAIGSIQTDAIQSHTHAYSTPTTNNRDGGTGATYSNREGAVTSTTGAVSAGARTSNETRPINAYVNYIIKF
jgi:microcystin-dependent protein